MSLHRTPPIEWRCPACQGLFGVAEGDQIELRYKTAKFRVKGEVTAPCRRCGISCRFSTVSRRPAPRAHATD
jgi:hypothetical protein